MFVDIDINHYYYKFISEAKADLNRFKGVLTDVEGSRNKSRQWLEEHKQFLKDKTGINLDEYDEWVNNEYNKNELLANKALDKLKYFEDSSEQRIAVLQVLRYAKLLVKVKSVLASIDSAAKRHDMPLRTYKDYVKRYYQYAIPKCLLEGYAYKFGYGIGDLLICRWKYTNPRFQGKMLDYKATNEARRKLISEGKRPFKLAEKRAYDEAGVPYDGVKYAVFKYIDYYDEVCLYNQKVIPHRYMKVKFTFNGIAVRGKQYTYESIAAECKSFDEVCALEMGIGLKIKIALAYDPTIYLNFMRNPDCKKYERGVHNTKIIKRY